MQDNFPSVKTLMRVFNNEDYANTARLTLKMKRADLEKTVAGAELVKRCQHPPDTAHLRMWVLNAIDPGLHGVESGQIGDEYFDYLNTGETYATTIIFWRDRYRVQSVGDFVEKNHRSKS